MTDSLSNKWNQTYNKADPVQYPPASVLLENSFLLPETGNALDLACGLGNNACFLAEQGLDTEAWDISAVAIDKLQHRAAALGVQVNARVCRIDRHSLSGKDFDVILVSRFLDRSICDAIIGALKPGGLLFYQKFTREKFPRRKGPSNPEYLMKENELLKLFAALRVVCYQEHALIGDTGSGLRNEALFIGQKRMSN